jgi:hypothetical protein
MDSDTTEKKLSRRTTPPRVLFQMKEDQNRRRYRVRQPLYIRCRRTIAASVAYSSGDFSEIFSVNTTEATRKDGLRLLTNPR